MVTVKLFGTLRLDSGIKELSVSAGVVKDLLPLIAAEMKKIDPSLDITVKDLKGCIMSVNNRQVTLKTKLNDGDVLFMLPAVGGG